MPKFLAIMLVLVSGLMSAVSAGAADPLSFGVVSTTDLTSVFHTKTKWSLVITHEPYDGGAGDTPVGNLHFCFVHDGKTSCSNTSPYNIFESSSTFQPRDKSQNPLIVVTAGWTGGGSAFLYGPLIWAYHPKLARFDLIFSATENKSNNGEVRFITSGPLAGDVVLDRLTSPWPYRYNIVVYRLLRSESYVKILDYNGNTTEGDGNALAVIDAEMPQIEQRLHVWKLGDPLPTISQNSMPPQCKTGIRLQKGLLWCEWSQ
jgi:hypothetical protein